MSLTWTACHVLMRTRFSMFALSVSSQCDVPWCSSFATPGDEPTG